MTVVRWSHGRESVHQEEEFATIRTSVKSSIHPFLRNVFFYLYAAVLGERLESLYKICTNV